MDEIAMTTWQMVEDRQPFPWRVSWIHLVFSCWFRFDVFLSSRKPMVEAQERQSQASLARCHKRFALLNPGQGEISDDNRRNQVSFRHMYPKKQWWQRHMMSGPRLKNQRLGDSMISRYWENIKTQKKQPYNWNSQDKPQNKPMNTCEKYH